VLAEHMAHRQAGVTGTDDNNISGASPRVHDRLIHTHDLTPCSP